MPIHNFLHSFIDTFQFLENLLSYPLSRETGNLLPEQNNAQGYFASFDLKKKRHFNLIIILF